MAERRRTSKESQSRSAEKYSQRGVFPDDLHDYALPEIASTASVQPYGRCPAIFPSRAYWSTRASTSSKKPVETNHYSVPPRYVGRDAIVGIYENSVKILVGDQCVAEHRRGRGKREFILNPLHYIDVIAHKHRSATRALAFANERLPRSLIELRDRLLERDGPTATKTWMAALQLALKSSLSALGEATEIALASGTLDPEAIALILRQRDPRVTAMIDLEHHRGAPALQAQVIDLDAYRIAGLVEPAI